MDNEYSLRRALGVKGDVARQATLSIGAVHLFLEPTPLYVWQGHRSKIPASKTDSTRRATSMMSVAFYMLMSEIYFHAR
jgi:hypothetical protein